MNVLKLVLYAVVVSCIELGDSIISFVRMLRSHLYHFLRRTMKSREIVLYQAHSRTIKKKLLFKVMKSFVKDLRMFCYTASEKVFVTIKDAVYSFATIHKEILTRVMVAIQELLSNIERVIKHLYAVLRRIGKTTKRKLFRKKQKKEIVYRPTFFSNIRFFVLGIFVSFFIFFLPLLGFVLISDLPNPSSLSANYIPKTTKIYDRNGVLLYEIYANQNRTLTHLSDLPKYLIDATVAIEDRDFFSHPGFDLRGIARAALSNIKNKDLQGGSTITQQLIKSAYLSATPTFERKVKEIALAFWAERMYSKNQILELYFNYVPYGGTAWGIQAASDVYFGKNAKDLTLAQAAFLAGLPRAPSIYSPYSSTDKSWKKRQKEVLDAMEKLHIISHTQANEAYKEELVFHPATTPIKAPHFVMYVKDQLVKQYGLSEVEKGGLIVKTTLDYKIQQMAEQVVAQEVENSQYLGFQNGAAVVTDPRTGDILAMVGSKDYFDNAIDGNVNITTSKRQPGSTIKLVTYTLGLSSGMTEATLVDDTPLTITTDTEVYTPVNYDGTFHGRLPLRIAFANSLNIPAVRVAQKFGVNNIVKMGQQMGISSWTNANKYGISITLGGAEVTMLDLTSAYGTIANKGKRAEINGISEIRSADSAVMYNKPQLSQQVVDPGVAFIISDILADNKARSMEFGPTSPLNVENHKVSVKTGTTDNKRDNWTIGYTPRYVVATWVGNTDNTPMSQSLASGITGAAPIWNKIMTNLLQSVPDVSFETPSNVIKKNCFGKDAYFISGTENSVACSSRPTPSIAR